MWYFVALLVGSIGGFIVAHLTIGKKLEAVAKVVEDEALNGERAVLGLVQKVRAIL